jgi:hypothetical protein
LTTDVGTDGPAPRDPRSPAEIRHDLQKTRADLDATVDALGRRLKPRNLLWEARRRVEPEAREAGRIVATRARDNKKTIAAAAGVLAGAWLLRRLARRRRAGRTAFPPGQAGS